MLLARGRGSGKDPGEFRRSQNWIGGTRPGNAVFVPPPHTAVADCMADLERFLHDDRDGLPVLVRGGPGARPVRDHPPVPGRQRPRRSAAHHPAALPRRRPARTAALPEPLLQAEPRRVLPAAERGADRGDWEAWLEFFLEGVDLTAAGAVDTTRRLEALANEDRLLVQAQGRRAGSALRVHDALRSRPLLTLTRAAEMAGLSYPTVSSAMDLLARLGIAREISGRARDRVYSYERYLAVLSQWT